MDINARINWMPGMELTAETFNEVFEKWDFRQRLAIRAALGCNHMAIVPGTNFSCNGTFVKSRLEVTNLKVMALLPSGRIVNAEEDIQVPIPMLFGDKYYLTIGYGEGNTEFDKQGVPHVRPQYEYALHTLEELETADLFPLQRILANDGVLTIDNDFITPCLLLEDNPCFKKYIDVYTELMNTLATHANMADGEGKRAFLRYVFRLKSFHLQNTMQDFILLTQEMAQAIDYYVMTPNNQAKEIPVTHNADIQLWLGWLEDYMQGAAVVLDGVVLDNTVIDYEALLAQAKAELYEKLHPELIEKLLADMKAELQEEMRQQTEKLTTYINENLKNAILEELKNEMDDRTGKMSQMLTEKFEEFRKDTYDQLYDKLYFQLFESLFNALYVPEPEELKFVPQI